MTVLLRDAMQPEPSSRPSRTIPPSSTAAPSHNIAHGCNSVIATKTALKLADYVVTEAGFGADLGAEKFLNIKCRKAGLAPACVVLVATIPGDEDERRRGQGRPRGGERRGGERGLREPRPPHSQRQNPSACRWWWRSTISSPTPKPRSAAVQAFVAGEGAEAILL